MTSALARSAAQLVSGLLLSLLSLLAVADPVALDRSYAGNINFVVTGASMRTQSNAGNPCAVTNGPVSATLAGIPAGATITAAYLYWGGSGPAIDNEVVFEGVSILADQTFTETFNQSGFNLQYFGGLRDIRSFVQAKGNGSYSLANLAVTTTDLGGGATYCSSSAVVAGWGMIVIYDSPSEPLRVVNLFDGLQFFRGGSITLTPNNFVIPASPVDGRFAVLSWEGDVENSAPLNGFTENLAFNGTGLTGPFNPANNQFNSTVNVIGSNTTYGVDFDLYDVSALLSPGDTSASTVYASGGDLVLLALEAIAVTNTPVADLSLAKTVSSTLLAGDVGQFRLRVTNNGPSDEPTQITLTDTLTASLTYAGFTSTDANWSCSAAGQDVTCVYAAPVTAGTTLADLFINVTVAEGTNGTVITNSAQIVGTLFDNVLANNTSSVDSTISAAELATSTKTVEDLNGGDPEAGDVLRYTITLQESAGFAVSGVRVTDDLPAAIGGFTVTAIPTGATDDSLPAPAGANGAGFVDITGISVPANGSVSIVFEAVIAGTVSPGDVISNVANVPVPIDSSTSIGPATITVAPNSVPGNGVKPLYAHFSSAPLPADIDTLQRIAPTVNSQTANIDGAGGIYTATQSPALVRDLALQAGNVPVLLCLDRQGSGAFARNVQVTLSSVGTTVATLGSVTLNNILAGNGFQPVVFNVPVAAQTLLAGSSLRLTITNASFLVNLRVRAAVNGGSCSAPSQIQLNSATVINVESVETYDAAFNGGVAQSIVIDDGASTYYARARVSDPFGSFDITSAVFELFDKDGVSVTGALNMGLPVDDNVAAGERTYETSFTVPAYTSSPYTLRVTANEGTEGIFDVGVSGLQVRPLPPMLSVSKVASRLVGGPQVANADPSENLFFTVQVSNMGAGPATNVVVDDAFRAFLALGLNSYGAGQPFEFVDGAPSSGLTLGTPLYSDDDGASYGYTLVDGAAGAAAGYDGAVTHFRIPFTGTMPPGGSFTLRYQMRVE